MTVRKVSSMQSYLDEDVEIGLVEDEDENEFSDRSSSVQSGWEASARLFTSNSSTEKKSSSILEFRFTEEPQVVKFLDADPIPFYQHWVNARTSGRKAFICVDPDGSKKNCPLCKIWSRETKQINAKTLSRRSVERKAKVAFNVVIVGDDEPRVLFLETGQRLFQQLSRLHADPKNGPLPKIFWALSRSGTALDTVHHVTPVKPRDLAEDWGMDPLEFIGSIADLKPMGYRDLRHSSVDELQEIAEEIDA